MWYFSAILGLGLVSFFAILNAMWLELDEDDHEARLHPESRRDEPRP